MSYWRRSILNRRKAVEAAEIKLQIKQKDKQMEAIIAVLQNKDASVVLPTASDTSRDVTYC